MSTALANFKGAATQFLGKAGLKIKAYSPEILLGVGIVGVTAGVVLACKATLKVDEIIESHDEIKQKIEDAHDAEIEEYTEDDYKSDKAKLYLQTAVKVVKNYGPATLCFASGVACILASHGIIKKRNASIISAYNCLNNSFKRYRQNVIEEFGEEKDRDLKAGIVKKKISTTDEEGKKVKKDEKVFKNGYGNYSNEYSRFFDESNPNYDPNPHYNKLFLQNVQNAANDMLHAKGYLFLNDVYDMLGLPRSSAGQVVGWLDSQDGELRDRYVDFNIFQGYTQAARDFVNEMEPAILLDFNVDGVIYDQLWKVGLDNPMESRRALGLCK